MAIKLTEMDFDQKISRNDLLKVLKNEARSIHIQDIMKASNFIRDDAKFMPRTEREDYIARFTKAFFARIKDIKDDGTIYTGEVDPDTLLNFWKFRINWLKNPIAVMKNVSIA